MPAEANEFCLDSSATLAVPVIASALRNSSIDTDVFYFNLEFAGYLKELGFKIDRHLDNYNGFHFGLNALFAELCWGTKYDGRFFAEALKLGGDDARLIQDVKPHIRRFFDFDTGTF